MQDNVPREDIAKPLFKNKICPRLTTESEA